MDNGPFEDVFLMENGEYVSLLERSDVLVIVYRFHQHEHNNQMIFSCVICGNPI